MSEVPVLAQRLSRAADALLSQEKRAKRLLRHINGQLAVRCRTHGAAEPILVLPPSRLARLQQLRAAKAKRRAVAKAKR